MANHMVHRPGSLKQSNKAHKTGRHRSNRAVDNAAKGRVSVKVLTHKHKQEQRREQRRNQMNQLRKNKREETIAFKRQLGGQNTAPFLVCVLPMHQQVDANSALEVLMAGDTEAEIDKSKAGVTYVHVPRFKQRFAFIVPPVGPGNELAVLDYLKVADTTLLVTTAALPEEEIFDDWGLRLFPIMSAQGIPTPIVALMDLESINPKRRTTVRAAAQKFISQLLPDEKLMKLDTAAEGLNMLRRIGGQKKNVLHNKANRPHLFGDVVEFVPSETDDLEFGSLRVTGFLRGTALNVNGLVHLPELGDFQMSHITSAIDPLNKTNAEICLLAKADPQQQQSLQSENIPDPMDVEQTWPTEQEIEMSRQENLQIKRIKRVPKGMSSYQAAWIPDIEEVATVNSDASCDEDDDDDDDDDEMNDNDEFMSCEDKSFDDEYEQQDEDTPGITETESVSDFAAINDEKYDNQMDFQEERETLRKIKESRMDELWPDEINTPKDVPARERFQKYRGLESFRTSTWDAKENLPSDYARIYQFRNFERTKRRIIAEAKKTEGVQSGKYITLHISNVPVKSWNAYQSAQKCKNLVVFGLLPHEQRMCVMNVVLKRMPDSEAPIKSKERLIIQCGYRRFAVNPIYSQHTNGDKHKFERYFRAHTTLCATFYAPIQFPPAPVLAFKENPNLTLKLMARGCVLSCNPNRIIVKRVVLSGHPMRINRKSATVRYMFFNKEDIEYFKPVKLRTKCGRLGHIKESLGTHGHMKCVFDGQLRSYDTVFMYLYKRVYPKWTYEECTALTAQKR